MSDADRLMRQAQVHPQWQPILADALATLDPEYLHSLLQDDNWLPGADQLLSAFKRDRLGVRYLLFSLRSARRYCLHRKVEKRCAL